MSFADKVSLIRIILIPFFLYYLIHSKNVEIFRFYAICIFVLAVLTDFLDGLIARIKKEKSAIGQIIDPLADKLLMVTAFLALYLLGFAIPLWVVVTVLSRDIIVLLGILILHMLKVDVRIDPSLLGKLTTTFQMLTIFVVLIENEPFFSIPIWSLATFFTLVSGVKYVARGIKAYNESIHSSGF